MSLDTKGITLDEVKLRYPRRYQTIGYDALLDTDVMFKPKVISSFELAINSILTLLFMKPGQYPSIPELGIDIESYLHEYSNDPQIPLQIQSKLEEQCNQLSLLGLDIQCFFDKTEQGVDALVLKITGNDVIARGLKSDTVIIGISYDKLNRLYVRKVFV